MVKEKFHEIEDYRLKTSLSKKVGYSYANLIESLIGGFIHHEDPIFSFFIGVEIFIFY